MTSYQPTTEDIALKTELLRRFRRCGDIYVSHLPAPAKTLAGRMLWGVAEIFVGDTPYQTYQKVAKKITRAERVEWEQMAAAAARALDPEGPPERWSWFTWELHREFAVRGPFQILSGNVPETFILAEPYADILGHLGIAQPCARTYEYSGKWLKAFLHKTDASGNR